MKIISCQEFLEQWQDSGHREILTSTDGFEVLEKYQGRWIQGESKSVELRSGLRLEVCDDIFQYDLGIPSHHSTDFVDLTAKFFLSGTEGVISPPGIKGVAESYEERAGQSYLYYLPDIDEIEQHLAGDRIHFVRLSMNIDFIRSFSSDSSLLPQQLLTLIESNNAPRFHRPAGALTPAMQMTIHQIINAPYRGMVQRMYLEGKALELAALQIAQLVKADNGKQEVMPGLKPADIERIYYAKDILTQNWLNPPSLLALAREVGLNDYKLKQGFRYCFGATVFGYLQSYRLELAKQLLSEGDSSIIEVAHSIGYASPTSFSTAFKRKFGISPKKYQKQVR
ncbi:MAG: helix-turn-helix transcriptional regulator [Pleurocapsa sp.]